MSQATAVIIMREGEGDGLGNPLYFAVSVM